MAADLCGRRSGGEVTCDGLAFRPGAVQILLTASCYGNRDKLRQHEPVLASRPRFSTDLTYYLIVNPFLDYKQIHIAEHQNVTNSISEIITAGLE